MIQGKVTHPLEISSHSFPISLKWPIVILLVLIGCIHSNTFGNVVDIAFNYYRLMGRVNDLSMSVMCKTARL